MENLASLVTETVNEWPEKLREYKEGKTGLLGLFVGEAMKKSKGKAEPKELNRLMIAELAAR